MPATLPSIEKCCAAEHQRGATDSLLVFADDWGRHPSSCQHLVRRLQRDARILWVNSIGTRRVKANALTLRRAVEKFRNWGQGLKQVAEQMWVVDLPMIPGLGWRVLRDMNRSMTASRLKRILSRLGMTQPDVVTTLPYMEWLIRDLPRRSLTYYCTDDYSHWPGADRELIQQADRELSSRADCILAASKALVEQHEHTGRCAYFPHGVDLEHFRSAQDDSRVPQALRTLRGPRIGFFGLIYEKLDFELLSGVARQFPHASLVMIGPVAHCPSNFRQIPNVHFLGPQPYEELPRYIAGLDVLLLPYVDDPMIRQSGPLKLRECLASGKPTVSIDLPDVRAYQPHVRIGTDREAFLAEVRMCLEAPQDPARILARQNSVAQDGWDQRAAELRAHLEQTRRGTGSGRRVLTGPKPHRRILHLRTISGKGGGPEKTLLNSPRFLRDAYALRLAYIRPEGDEAYDMPERARRMGVDFVDIPEQGPADPRTLVRLVREMKDFRPDLLHAHDYKTNVLSVLLGRMFGIPVVTTLHGYVTRGGRLEAYYALDRWALRQMEHVVAVSPDLYQLATSFGIPRPCCSLIENAIDAEQYRRGRSRRDAKEALGLSPDDLVLGAVGRLSPEKGFDLLIRAVHETVQQSGTSLRLLIVGEGPQRGELESLIEELGLNGKVRLQGFSSDVKAVYEAMDVFVLSSLREGLPNVVLEAMAMELAVVATRVAGVPRLLEDGVNGLLIEPGKVQDLTQAIARLCGDAGLRRRMGEAARETVATRFSFAARMQAIRNLYDSILDKRNGSRNGNLGTLRIKPLEA